MSWLRIEAAPGGGDLWVLVGPVLRKGDPPGSLSNNTPDGRQIILFACMGDHSVICRSRSGLDIADNENHGRYVVTLTLEGLASLKTGDHFQMMITTDHGLSMPFRWTHIGA